MNGNLVLSRKVSEVIVVDLGEETIEVEVGRIGTDTVRLIVRAPKHLNVRRAELEPIAMGCGSLSNLPDPEHAAAQVLLNISEQEETDAMFRAREVKRVAAND